MDNFSEKYSVKIKIETKVMYYLKTLNAKPAIGSLVVLRQAPVSYVLDFSRADL